MIDFNNFFSELPRDSEEDPALIGRAIDTKIAPSLFMLPIPGAEGGGDNVLAFRNLCAASSTTCPRARLSLRRWVCGSSVTRTSLKARRFGTTCFAKPELTSGGAELGPVGGGIVAEVFVDLLRLGGVTAKPIRRNCQMYRAGTSASGTCWLPPTSPG